MQCDATRTFELGADTETVSCALDQGHRGLHDTLDLGGFRYEWSDEDGEVWLAKAVAPTRDACGVTAAHVIYDGEDVVCDQPPGHGGQHSGVEPHSDSNPREHRIWWR